MQLGPQRDLIHHICEERSIHDGNLFFPSFSTEQPGTVESNLRVQRASRSTNSISFLSSQHSNRAITLNFPEAYFNLVFRFKLVLLGVSHQQQLIALITGWWESFLGLQSPSEFSICNQSIFNHQYIIVDIQLVVSSANGTVLCYWVQMVWDVIVYLGMVMHGIV